MGNRSKVVARAVAVCVALTLVACPSKGKAVANGGAPLKFARGGTVRVGVVADSLGQSGPDSILDPAKEYSAEPWEILRCCLARTLYQYAGRTTNDGGAQIMPDLATSLPVVSADGLTWTIHIRKGVHYAPPLAQQEVVAQDFVTALKRVAKVTKQDGGDYAVYYSVIEGFDRYSEGGADTISGVATPDPYTLVFSLTARAGDFADRLVLPATSPIPTLAAAPGEFGVATGHDTGYGPYLISTGPYMYAGSEAMTPAAPAKQQKPPAGFLPGAKVITLVRNPSWVPSTDPLRPAYSDRIELVLATSPDQLSEDVSKNVTDVFMFGGPPNFYPVDIYRRYKADPSLGTAAVDSGDSLRYVSFNLAVPPFDDVHVRKAANFIADKQAILAAAGGPLRGSPATHMLLDSFEDNVLLGYAPYRTSSRSDALEKAKAEMRLSKYDTNHDGICDAAACKGIRALAFPKMKPNEIRAARILASNLAEIGLQLKIDPVSSNDFFQQMATPTDHIPIGIDAGWSKDFFNAGNFVTPLLAGSRVSTAFSVPGATVGGCCNYGLLGATSSQLAKWHYRVRSVPSADDRINECLELVGTPQADCWTELDQYLTETVVPWIPMFIENSLVTYPTRVVNYSLDQWTTCPSLDQLVVRQTPTPSGS